MRHKCLRTHALPANWNDNKNKENRNDKTMLTTHNSDVAAIYLYVESE